MIFLEQAYILVHPGYFFDFEEEPVTVVSLLQKREIFEQGMDCLLISLTNFSSIEQQTLADKATFVDDHPRERDL